MSMYLSNSDVRPAGAEVVEFIDYPPHIAELVADGSAASWEAGGMPPPPDDDVHDRRTRPDL